MPKEAFLSFLLLPFVFLSLSHSLSTLANINIYVYFLTLIVCISLNLAHCQKVAYIMPRVHILGIIAELL